MEQQPTTAVPPTSPALPGPTALLRTAWAAYTEHPIRYSGIAVLPALYAIAVAALTAFARDLDTLTVGAVSVTIVLVLVSMLLNAFTEIALIATVRDPAQPLTFRAAFAFAWKHFLPLLAVAALYAAVTLGGFVLFIAPGIVLGVALSFSQFAAVNEGLRGFAALFRSRAYVAGRWADIFVRGLFLALIAIPFSLVLAFLGAGIDALSPVDVGDTVQGVLAALIGLPVGVLYTATLYRAVRNLPLHDVKRPSVPRYSILAILGALALLALLGSPLFAALFV